MPSPHHPKAAPGTGPDGGGEPARDAAPGSARARPPADHVDDQGAASFPASDAPSDWAGGDLVPPVSRQRPPGPGRGR